MATKMYLRSAVTPVDGTQLAPLQPTDAGAGGIYNPGGLTTGKGSSSVSQGNRNTVTGPTSGIIYNTYTSPQLAAGVTISGTITVNLRGIESSMNANVGYQVSIKRIQPDGTASDIVATSNANSEQGVELGTTETAQNWTITPTSTACNKGDVIIVQVWGNDAGGTMATGFTFQVQLEGPTDAASGDSYVQFNETLTFTTTTPAGTKLFLGSAASTVTVTGEDERQMTTVDPGTGSASTSTTNTVTGPTAGVKCTATAGASDYLAWYSDTFATGTTLTGPIRFRFAQLAESNLSANCMSRFEVYVCNGDGTSPTLWCGNWTNTIEMGTGAADTGAALYINAGDLSVSAGQRLMLRYLIDDVVSITSTTNQASGFTSTWQFNHSNSYITLQESPTFGVAATSFPPLTYIRRPNFRALAHR